MRVCMPTMGDNGIEERVHNHFGSAAFFTVVDTDKEAVEVVKNGNEHHQHGGCQPLKAIAGLNVDAILTSGMGRRAVHLLNEGGMKVYLLEGETVKDAVELFKKGKLKEMTADMACGGHSGCNH